MRNKISLCSVLLAATLLFIGCTLLEKKDAVPVASNRSEDLSDKKPKPDTQNALPSSVPKPDIQSTVPSSAPNPIPTSETQKTEKPTATFLITTKNGSNVRSKPNGKSKVMATLKKGQILQQIDQMENWYNIILPSGKRGWIHKDLVQNTSPVLNASLQTTSSESQKTPVQPQENVLPPQQTQKAAPQIKTDIKTDKDNYNYGETIKVHFFNSPGNPQDWICIVPIGSPDNDAGDYKSMPQGLNEGILTFDAPSSGKYEARAYYNYRNNGYVVSARYGFSVGGGGSSSKAGGISSGKSEESTPSEGRIIVPGGLKNGKLNNLWKAAKNKCFELGYVVSNEDRETGNIFCTKQFEGTPRTMQINFNDKGFLVVTQSPFGGGFLARFDRSTPLHKSEMESALKQVAGVKD